MSVGSTNNNFIVGASGEFINTTNLNYARSVYFHATTSGGFDYGANYLTHADASKNDENVPSEFLFNFTKEIYRYNRLIINLGVHDIPLSSNDGVTESSVFLAFIAENITLPRQYFLSASAGVGSGRINDDPHDYASPSNHANLFFGLNIKTPWMSTKKNSLNLMFEYIDGGIHAGVDIPINKNIKMQLAFTHIQNLYKFNDYENENTETIHGDAAGIGVGFWYSIPTKNNILLDEEISLDNVRISEPENNCYIGLIEANKNQPLIINDGCTVNAIKQIVADVNGSFQALSDSILMLNQTMTGHELTNNYLEIKASNLKDSLKTSLLNSKILQTELNSAIKSLTNSLKYYYTNEYHLALKELDKTIEYIPTLAVAYARRGSIYYKLGDLDRATVNWNYALQLDPEYKEVQDILINIKNKDQTKNWQLPE